MIEWWFSDMVITKGEFVTAIIALFLMGIPAAIFEVLWLKEVKKNEAISSKHKSNPKHRQ